METGVMAGNCEQEQSSFAKAIETFKEGLGKRDLELFRNTTLQHLRTAIVAVQTELHAQRRLRDLNRLERFLEAIEQYGEVASKYYSSNETVALIWGPLKFLLQTTSVSDEALREILNSYECIGEALPLLLQYQELFRAKRHMTLVLALIYQDVLEYQSIILRYFQQPLWQDVFNESWETCKSRFSFHISNIAEHRSLIENECTPSQIDEVRVNIQQKRQEEESRFDWESSQRIRNVLTWLRPTNVDVDQATLVKARTDYPKTGQWLFENASFKGWFEPRFPAIPPLLWINGIPGAGKTMLASLVVQKARELEPAPAVLYFYCKHDTPERDNFVALGRSLLAQLLIHDKGLLPTFYKEYCRSGETVLSSSVLVETLLNLAFGNCKGAYIILDGIDECPRKQREIITHWFRKLVEDLPSCKADRFRCVFLSQDDGPARKDYYGLESIKIKPEDSQYDIREYCQVEAGKLHGAYPSIPEEKAQSIAATVAKSVGGLFLLARLIWTNLSCLGSIARLEEELEPNVFPKEINGAYRRIMARISEQANKQEAMEDVFRLLSWLVCAKRPLKWHEIQGMSAINLEERCVDFERKSYFKSPKDLLASLVEVRADGSLEFVHSTVKLFLLSEGHVVPFKEELNLASLCIDYLNLPAFVSPPTAEGVLNGDYGFVDYAVLFWLRHLETGATLKPDDQDEPMRQEPMRQELMRQLAESLGIFVEQHWNSPTNAPSLAKRYSDKLQDFRPLPFYDHLEKAVASTRKQLKHFGNMNEREVALNLGGMVCDVRKVLENVASDELEPNNQQILKERYGDNLFKCPRLSCQFFTVGFSEAAERDDHISKHERPFRCSDEKCFAHTFGFVSEIQREKHIRENHEVARQDEEFPTEEEVERSHLNGQNQPGGSSQVPEDPLSHDGTTGDATTKVAIEQPESEAESEAEPQYPPQHKRTRKTEFKCAECGMIFNRQYNLTSHLLTHYPRRDHVCSICQKDFMRLGDLTRHKRSSHIGERNFICRGTLRNGESWGCGKTFARAETLRKHHESRVGRSCIELQQQELGEQIQQ